MEELHKHHQVLVDFSKDMGFDLVLITDSEGLPIASSSSDYEQNEIHAAVLNKMKNFMNHFSSQLDLIATSELTIRDQSGKLIVVKPFISNGSEFAIVSLHSDPTKTYKRSLKKLVRVVQDNWNL